MFWESMRRLQGSARRLALVPPVFLGFCFTRRWGTWLTAFSQGEFVGTGAFDTVVLAANPAALLACVLLIGRTGSLLRHGWLILVSTGALVAGSACALFSCPDPLALAGSTLAMAGFGVMFLMWLELYGALEVREMIVAYFGSLVLQTAFHALMHGFDTALAPYLVLALPVCGACCLVASVLRLRPAALATLFGTDEPGVPGRGEPHGERQGATSSGPAVAALRPRMDRQTGRLLAWIAVFGVAFGMGDAATGMGTTGSASAFGRSAFALVTVAVALFAARGFTLRAVYRMALPLMMAGLAAAFLFDANPWVSQLLMSAGMEGYQALGLIVCCGVARRDAVSAGWLCGIVFALEVLAIQAGNAAMGLIGVDAAGGGLVVGAGACAILALVMATMWLFKEDDLVASYSERALRSVQENRRLARQLEDYAVARGLTEKERDVFFLMASGKSAKDIAGELYLASGTVRAHTSKIYQKLGVHTRREFDELVGPLMGRG